jgi:hypothetical protein
LEELDTTTTYDDDDDDEDEDEDEDDDDDDDDMARTATMEVAEKTALKARNANRPRRLVNNENERADPSNVVIGVVRGH